MFTSNQHNIQDTWSQGRMSPVVSPATCESFDGKTVYAINPGGAP